jgi:hypothetical protein
VYDALETEAATGVGAGRFRTYIGKPKAWTRITASSSGRRRHQKAYIGKWSPSQRGGDGAVDRVAAFRRYHRRWEPKPVTRRCLYRSGASGLSRQDHRREPDNPVVGGANGRCRSTSGSSTMRTCGVEQAEQGRLEERQDGEGAAPIPKRAASSSIVTLQP